MDNEKLDKFLRIYEADTNHEPSQRLLDNILAVPDNAAAVKDSFFGFRLNLWAWFDLMIPKAVGWALTCILGVYIGVISSNQGDALTDNEYYLYNQAQFLLSEQFADDTNTEDNQYDE